MRQNSPDSLVALHNLTAQLQRATHTGAQLRPILHDLVQAMYQHWPGLAQINIYLPLAGGTLARYAGLDLALDAALDPVPEALAAQLTAETQPEDAAPQPARWIIPLGSEQSRQGIFEVVLADDEPTPPILEPVLLALAVPLAFAIEHLQAQPAPRVSTMTPAFATLYEISQKLSAQSSSPAILHDICKQLTDSLALDYIAVLRFDVMAAVARVIAEHPVRLGQETRLPLAEFGIYQHFQTSQTPLLIEDIRSSDELGANRVLFQSLNLQSMLMSPLVVQDDLLGGLVFAVADQARALTETDRQIAQVVATEIALSLRSTEFFTEIQRRANQLERISAFGRLVTGTLDQSQILQHVIEVVPNLLPADQVSVAFYSLEQNHMTVFELSDGITPQEFRLTAAGSSVEEVVQKYNPLLINDLVTSNYTDHQRLVQQGLQSTIVAPLMVSGRVLGTVSVGHKHARIYTPTDLNLLQQISNQIAIALENAHIFSSAQQRATFEEALSEITSHLQEQSDLRMMLQQTLQDFGSVLGAKRARVRLQVTPSELDISKLFQPKE